MLRFPEVYDPMLIMIQIGTLAFKPMKTKFYFHNNGMVLQDNNYTTSIVRTFTIDSHREIGKLEPLIKEAIQYYSPNKNPLIHEIFTQAVKGLEQLKNTYLQKQEQDPTLAAAISNNITLLKVNLEKQTKTQPEATAKLLVKQMEPNEIPLLNQKMIAVWSEHAYREVLDYFNLAKTAQGDTSVDVQQKAIGEIELIESFIAHKIKVLQYKLKTENYK